MSFEYWMTTSWVRLPEHRGLTRRVAFEGDDHWFGHVEADPDTMSGWHHDGDTITLGYVLAGQITIEHGPGGSRSMRVGPGGFFTVPAGTIHRGGKCRGRGGRGHPRQGR